MTQDSNEALSHVEGTEPLLSESERINELLNKKNAVFGRANAAADNQISPDLASLHVGTPFDAEGQIRSVDNPGGSADIADRARQHDIETIGSAPEMKVDSGKGQADLASLKPSATLTLSGGAEQPAADSVQHPADFATEGSVSAGDSTAAFDHLTGLEADGATTPTRSEAATPSSARSSATDAQSLPSSENPSLNASDDQGSVGENSAAVIDVLANDVSSSGSYSLSRVSIASGQGSVRIVDGQLHYDPGTAYDHLGNGEQAQVSIDYGIVNDAGETDAATLKLTIIGGNDAPIVERALSDQTALEDTGFSFTVPNDAFRDVDQSDDLTYSATLADGGALPDWLRFDPETRTFSGTPNNDHVGDLRVSVTATDSEGADVSDSFSLMVANANDAPDDLALDGNSVVENAVAGTVIGTVVAHDSDTGDSLTYALMDDADGRFAIDSKTGEITVADRAGLDFETAASHEIGVRVTDQFGASHDETFTINIADVAEMLTATQGNDTLIGGAGEDVISGLGGADRIDGGAGDDSLSGGRGKDSLIGADGDDVLDGGSSHDTLLGGAGDDTLIGGSTSGGGKNTEIGGNDTLYGGEGFDTLFGGDGADTLFGGADDDVLDGGVGNDRLDGGAGADIIDGGAGSDRLSYENSDQAVQVDLSLGTASGGHAQGDVITNIEQLVGSAHDDVLIDNSGSNTLSGGAGDDHIDAGRGHDTVIGGDGDDVIIGDQGQDTMSGGDGDDTFRVEGSDVYYDNFDGGDGRDIIQGGDGDDVIRVHHLDTDDSIEAIDGGAGSNVLAGSGSSDRIDVSGIELTNIDHIDAGRGHDTVIGGDGDDVIIGGQGQDTMSGGDGDDTFRVEGSDVYYDNFDGGDGRDIIQGGDGDDVIRVHHLDTDDSIEAIDGGAGSNVLAGSGSSDRIDVSGIELTNIDHIDAGRGHDTVIGGDGDDVIIGGQGDDTLYGGSGDDILNGGDGADHFLLMMAQGNDSVSGGEGSWVDRVELQDGSGGSNIGDFGSDWTVTVENGAIENAGASKGPNGESHGWLDLTEDASGMITMQDGTELSFDGIEHISW